MPKNQKPPPSLKCHRCKTLFISVEEYTRHMERGCDEVLDFPTSITTPRLCLVGKYQEDDDESN